MRDMGRFAYRFGLVVEFALVVAVCVGAVSAYRSQWRESNPFTAAFIGLCVGAACVANEALMALIPGAPFWWAIPYFPLRTVAIPVAGIMVAAFSLRRVPSTPALGRRLAAAVGVAIGIAVVLFCWGNRDMLFFNVHEHPVAPAN
jgi:hypothetical protein